MNQPQGNFVDVDQFIHDILPGVIRGRAGLRALFTTYNNVSGYDDGEVETGDPSLEILVATGGFEVPGSGFGFMLGVLVTALSDDRDVRRSAADEMRARAGSGQAVVNEKLARQNEYPDIAVLYAGYSAFSSAIDTVRAIREKSPETYIAVLTCDCDLRMKLRELDAVGGIGAVIVTPECGGRRVMGGILDMLRTLWPNRLSSAV